MPASSGTRLVLIVEDDGELRRWIADYLQSKGLACMATGYGKEAIALALDHKPDLILLDGMLPDIDGVEVCKAIKANADIPIIMLTARDEEVDEVLGLEAGATDYLTKPIRAQALMTRIRKLLAASVLPPPADLSARPGKQPSPRRLQVSDLDIDPDARTVELAGAAVSLSSHEFDLLWLLASHAGEVVERDLLLKCLRGLDFDGFNRSIDLRISRLRKKLGDGHLQPQRIKTIWGRGYLLVK